MFQNHHNSNRCTLVNVNLHYASVVFIKAELWHDQLAVGRPETWKSWDFRHVFSQKTRPGKGLLAIFVGRWVDTYLAKQLPMHRWRFTRWKDHQNSDYWVFRAFLFAPRTCCFGDMKRMPPSRVAGLHKESRKVIVYTLYMTRESLALTSSTS